jgi:hypothetical protein
MRDNVQAGGPEDYFRKSITVPFLGYTLNENKVYQPSHQNCFGTTVGSQAHLNNNNGYNKIKVANIIQQI